MNYVGNLIKETRLYHGRSQGEVAKKASCHIQQISNIERGICSCPIPLAKKLCKSLGIERWRMRSSMVKDFQSKLHKRWGR